jgi:hypothetical protein
MFIIGLAFVVKLIAKLASLDSLSTATISRQERGSLIREDAVPDPPIPPYKPR